MAKKPARPKRKPLRRKPSADPIFAAIAEVKEATAEHAAVWAHVNTLEMPPDYKGYISHWEEEHTGEAYAREWNAWVTLHETTPTTLPGFVALFEYLASPRWPGSEPTTAMAWACECFMDADNEHWPRPTATQRATMIAAGRRRLL
jgi:hypothetical protein